MHILFLKMKTICLLLYYNEKIDLLILLPVKTKFCEVMLVFKTHQFPKLMSDE